MARFVRHTSCHECGSKDNRAVYDDGSEWCFGCHSFSSPKISPLVNISFPDKPHHPLPDDVSTHIGQAGVEWLTKYEVPIETLIARGVRWSNSRQQLFFTFPGTLFWQARNFVKGKPKYFTNGSHEDFLPVYYYQSSPYDSSSTVVLTEDCLSAIKIASLSPIEGFGWDAMPLLGTNLPSSKLLALKRHYSKIIVWLDHDKGKEAMAIATRSTFVGVNSRVVVTELDPKELDEKTIYDLLRESRVPK